MPKPTCTILDDYQGVALTSADWSAVARHAEIQVRRDRLASEDALIEAVAGSAIVVAMRERTPFRASAFARLPQLTWALILGLAKHLVPESTAFSANGPWQHTVGTDLKGRQLGVLGLGKIGTMVARVGLAFGMEVAAWSHNLTPERAASAGVRLAPSKASLLETSDVVSIHLVLSDRTRGLLGRDDLRRMKPTALLINTSRGPIVDEAALVTALREHWIAGAGLDVFDVEPVPADSPFRSLPNVLATPHLGYVTQANYGVYYGEAAEDVLAFLTGSPIRVVN